MLSVSFHLQASRSTPVLCILAAMTQCAPVSFRCPYKHLLIVAAPAKVLEHPLPPSLLLSYLQVPSGRTTFRRLWQP